MSHMLAVDVGGTKTLFELSDTDGNVIYKLRLDSQRFESFDLILTAFFEQMPQAYSIDSACIALAGPVSGQYGQVTKLPWKLDASVIEKQFSIKLVTLCNDFEAVGHGIASLQSEDFETLQSGESSHTSPRVVLGAGTGLGQAILIPDNGDWRVFPTEGGHVDFAPLDRTQQLFLEHLQQRHGHVSYDRIVCGSGLVSLYHFLRDYKQIDENNALRLAMVNGDAASAISQFAIEQNDVLANEALEMFVDIYAAQAGNLALTTLARGGVYLVGNILLKNIAKFRAPSFINSFVEKGRMTTLMKQIPVHIVLDDEVGLKGARLLAQKAMYN
ncbi:glucokinase [Methylophaga sulfidovorans]|uniref:Glucokinase n=1 Tax=Methylophaga sulfidovorans TaxID=45496 RepID=A0A1I3XHL0_9GAMM|nr:glucokinase [Methylophaga sulfidovorans]SFK18992.1 glucokinase [Methylophaga sulfidovorans]